MDHGEIVEFAFLCKWCTKLLHDRLFSRCAVVKHRAAGGWAVATDHAD